ncbi:MAG: alpha-(1-_3)-arabinofuranosyltransferase domain-containing protein [Candidatus Omnitrophota bacterium]
MSEIKGKVRVWLSDLWLMLGVGLTPLLWFRPGYMINGSDTEYPLNPIKWFWEGFFVWNNNINGGGDYYAYAPAGIFFHSLQALLQFLGFSLIANEKIFFVFWFFLSGLSIYFLMAVLDRESPNRAARWFAVLVYLFNPYQFNTWSNCVSAQLAAYCFMPLGLAIIILGLEERIPRFKAAIYFGLVSILGAGIGINFPVFIVVALFFAVYFVYSRGALFLHRVKFLLWLLVFYFLFNAYWILPTVHYIYKSFISTGANLASFNRGNWLEGISSNTSLLNVLRLMGSWDWYDKWMGVRYVTFAENYLHHPLMIVLSFLLPALVYSSLVVIKKNRYVGFFLLTAMLGTVFACGAHPPTGHFYMWLVEHFAPFSLFRSPWYKFTLLMTVSYAVLAGMVVGKKVRRRFLVPLFAVYLVFHYPMLTGEIVYPGRKVMPGFLVKIPEYIFASADFLKKEGDDFRVLLLPRDQQDIYRWGYSAPIPILNLLVSNPILFESWDANSLPPLDNLRNLFYDLFYNSDPAAYKLLRLMSARYVLQRNDAWFDFYGDTDSPQFIKERLARQKGLSLERSFGEWDFYKTENVLPYIYAADKAVFVKGDIYSFPELIEAGRIDRRPCIFFSRQSGPKPREEKIASASASREPVFLEYKKINPTRYLVRLKSGSDLWLVFNENYDRGWRCRIDSVYLSEHYMANGYANAWWIPTQGGKSFEVIIEYAPQQYFEWGVVIFLLGLSVAGVYLGIKHGQT